MGREGRLSGLDLPLMGHEGRLGPEGGGPGQDQRVLRITGERRLSNLQAWLPGHRPALPIHYVISEACPKAVVPSYVLRTCVRALEL